MRLRRHGLIIKIVMHVELDLLKAALNFFFVLVNYFFIGVGFIISFEVICLHVRASLNQWLGHSLKHLHLMSATIASHHCLHIYSLGRKGLGNLRISHDFLQLIWLQFTHHSHLGIQCLHLLLAYLLRLHLKISFENKYYN